jgi:hypothetical protein
MSRLLHLINDIRRKITDYEYKIILDEIATEENRRQSLSLSKVKIAIPWVGKQLDSTDECGDDPITIRHEFITLIVPTKYIQDNNITICKTYPLIDIFNNSLNHDIDSFIYRMEIIRINCIDIHNKTCIIIATESINKDSDHQDLDMEM